jgi:tryptophan 2,3-dioxygenase
MEWTPELMEKLAALRGKIESTGQDFETYVDGWQHAQFKNYWDYIQLETLLSLQRPVTDVPDEPIFIIYHQITELYFKLARIEIDTIAATEQLEVADFKERIDRLNRYFGALRSSFGVMEKGMKKSEFLAFRDALAPASGFQSAQYRIIELGCAPVINIVAESKREGLRHASIEEQMEAIYWRDGAKIESTGQPAYTAVQFIEKYWDDFLFAAQSYEHCNIWECFCQLKRAGMSDTERLSLEKALRLLDLNINVNWPLQHYKTAVRYLSKKPTDIAATGGTNWQKYLPPRFQRRIFYPELWTEVQRAEWGKSWVDDVLKEIENAK